MKKYIIPVTEIHEITIEQLIAASLPKGDGNEGVDGGGALSKEYDDEEGYWD